MAQRVKVRVRKKKSKKKRIIKRILVLFLLLIICMGGFAVYKIVNTLQAADKTYDELNRGEKSNLRDAVIDIKKKPFSVLFVGIEDYATKGDHGRSDSLIVATINPQDKTMKMVSIPRDTRVQLASDTTGSKEKINAAFAKGGKDETIETVEQFLHIPIDKYATVDFDGFKDVIDEVGGIDIDVPFDFNEKSDVKKSKKIYFKKGNMHLNGEEALAYARMRKQDPRGDFGRNDRQKQILRAMIDQMAKPNNIANVDNIAKEVSDHITTNFRITEGLALQQIYSGFKGDDTETLSIKGSDLYLGPNRTYYFEPDPSNLANVQNELRTHLKLPAESSTETDSQTNPSSGKTGTSDTTNSSTSTPGQ
ncbi:LytR family transcriptional regulator [Bacillus safensis]|uniref:LCP family protein n=1 Tax=Bacillus safensis TaxID=561879 RepID=UPI0007FB4264|nr:LCP family protein [Bacillus safensis]MBK4213304.1 LytR family transcriptional regulator [Bacillus pumilus]OBW51004.1 LytR family transcriptional regulator [Bacillus safensis]